MGEQAKGDVPVPAAPLPYLVLVQADLGLGLFESVFYAPAAARDPDQLVYLRLRRPVAEVVGKLPWIVDSAAHQQPAPRSGLRLRVVHDGVRAR